jgi:hypothetical protein
MDSTFLFESETLKAQISTNGMLFADKFGGESIFQFHDSEISMIQRAGLWIAGRDPSHSLKGAIHNEDNFLSCDFTSGRIDGFGQDKYWIVTADDIIAHVEDYLDNWVIDNPNPAIFGWPSVGNVYFPEYNDGLTLPEAGEHGLAGFFDRYPNGVYEPHLGEYPILDLQNYGYDDIFPEKILWMVINDQKSHQISGFEKIDLDIHITMFSINCEAEPSIKNSLFIEYKFINRGIEHLYDLYAGVYADLNVGCSNDDYIGTFTNNYGTQLYAYNAASQDENCTTSWEGVPPVVLINQLSSPFDDYANAVPVTSMPIYHSNIVPFGGRAPGNPQQYYNVLNNHFRDGSPLVEDGLGYQSSTTIADHIFPGLPMNINEWSERTAENPFFNRAALIKGGPFNLDHDEAKSAVFAFSIFDNPDAQNIDDQILFAKGQAFRTGGIINEMHINHGAFEYECSPITNTKDLTSSHQISISPNPSNGIFYLSNNNLESISFQVFTTNGQKVHSGKTNNQQIQLSHLSSGMYLLQLIMKDGSMLNKRIIIQK